MDSPRSGSSGIGEKSSTTASSSPMPSPAVSAKSSPSDDNPITTLSLVGPTIIKLNAPTETQPGGSAIISSGRSSLSSVTSSPKPTTKSKTTTVATATIIDRAVNLNQALALAANKWDREQRKNDQEVTRKLTVLRQRKISAVLKVENLQKSLKDTSNSSPNSIKSRLAQVRELEQEVYSVDNELTSIVKEREENNRRINTKKVHHINTLQELGLLEDESVTTSDGAYNNNHHSQKWRSEMDLQTSSDDYSLSMGTGSSRASPRRKISPPFPFAAAKFLSESRIRSGSDPALALKKANEKKRSGQDENKKPFASIISGVARRNMTTQPKGSPDSSPRAGRRNPLRMLSNAIDFRGKKRNQRPKSVECGRDYIHDHPAGSSSLSHNPSGLNSTSTSDLTALTSPRLLAQDDASELYGIGISRHSLPNLDPVDMQEAMNRVHGTTSHSQISVSSYATNPRTYKSKHNPNNLPPLENRNSAPEIVVTSHAHGQPRKLMPAGGLEDRIHRAKARVQSGLSGWGGSSSPGSTAHIPLHVQMSKPKLSSRFQSAQKLNSKILNNITSVKRSRTFNIRDAQAELASMGFSQTLPRKHQSRKTTPKTAGRYSVESSPENTAAFSYGSSTLSFDSSSTASSRKSSNSSTNPEQLGPSDHSSASSCASTGSSHQPRRTEASPGALAEIAAWEMFARNYFAQLDSPPVAPSCAQDSARGSVGRKLSSVEIRDLEL